MTEVGWTERENSALIKGLNDLRLRHHGNKELEVAVTTVVNMLQREWEMKMGEGKQKRD